MADSPDEIRKAVRNYIIVFIALLVGTIVTVLVATHPALDVGGHGLDVKDVVIGLIIASIKASLVAFVFMHLNHEKSAVYWIFGGSFIFAIALFVLTALAKSDPIHDPFFYGDAQPVSVQH
jgi:caa(3)-type oxidase subunit IV